MRRRIVECSTVLLVVGLLHLAFVVFTILGGGTATASVELVVVGAGMCAAAYAVGKQPTLTMIVTLILWGGYQLLAAMASPLNVVSGLFGKIVVLLFLCRGLYASIQADTIRRRLAAALEARA